MDDDRPMFKDNDESIDIHGGEISQIAFSNDGQRIVSNSTNGTVKLWDADSGECSYTLKYHGGQIHRMVFSPDSRHLASSADDKTVKIWDVDSGECKHTFKCQEELPSTFVFSPNSQRIAVVDEANGTIKIWNTNSGTCEITIKDDFKSTRRLVFSPDSQRIAADSNNDTITIWDVISDTTSACRIQTFEALENSLRYNPFFDFSTDGQRITFAVKPYFRVDDRRLLINEWDIASGNCVQTFEDLDGSELSIDFSSTLRKRKYRSSDDAIRKLGIGLRKSDWITLDGEALLWLPWEFRPTEIDPVYAVKDSTIAIGLVNGKVLVIRLALDSEAGAVLRPRLQ
ncbi:hypothetical protein E8E13_001147 [Curvularia kusanoi]|uniref:Uncharacterized protein n=1 Tax=Curvularia kusanoi TaxID=90978 RepID=A0A9P4TF58_CURKU|nr:hypothetical protein E8E13_001147 [Curvularia kusanoi]